ncbi:MAG: HEAT repeat domain-containing protein [Deltaproteobacteria bacterium]|nr:HEAT repeat domain-containing protein [Deltaproteobacteria bacterium]
MRPIPLKAAAVFLLLSLLGSGALSGVPEDAPELTPPPDVNRLLESLRHENSKVREAAAGALGKAGDPRAVDPLLYALGDPQDEVRNAAAAALKELGEPLGELIHTSLTASWMDGGNLAGKAREELAIRKDPRAVDPIARALGSWNLYVRVAAARTLMVLGGPRAVEPLIKAMGSRDKPVREAAAWALRKIGDARALDPMIEALGDSHEPVRVAAALTLGKLGDGRAVEPLVRALEDRDVDVRKSALWSLRALSAFGDAGTVDAMLPALGDSHPGVREAAVWALGNAGDPRAVDPLIATLRDEDAGTREAAAWTLGKLGDRRAVDPIVSLLGDDNVAVRNAGTRVLEGFGEPLGRLIYAAIEGVGGAGRELVAKKDPRAIEPLVRCLRNPEAYIRRNAAALLGSIGDRRAVDGLVDMAGGWDIPDRVAAMSALLQIDQEVIPGLLTAVLRVAVRPASLVFLLTIAGMAALFVYGRRRLRR